MKTLTLKKYPSFSYKKYLEVILQSGPQGGLTVSHVRKSMKALDALDKADDDVKFEDDIADFVKQRVSETKYNKVTKELVQFLDDVEQL